MGDPGGYNRDVTPNARSTRSSFSFSRDSGAGSSSPSSLREKKISEHLDPKKAMRNGWECCEVPGVTDRITPIVMMIDLTKTRGEDTLIAYDKTPLLIGQTVLHGYADQPQLSICGVGDVRFDQYPVQIGDFEANEKIDRNLKQLIIEEGGGGNGVESYLTALYGYARHSFLDCNLRGKKGYMFILGDEGFYPSLSKEEIKRIFGVEVDNDLTAEQIFAEVQEKYHVVYIYITKDEEERRKGIEAEIKKRLNERGGKHENVDIRNTIIWPTCDDLDAHVVTPSGEVINYRNPKSACGGKLDVDTNAGACKTRKAVENVRWAKGTAPKGWYELHIQNFQYQDSDTNMGEIPFTAERSVNGKTQIFEGVTPAGKTGEASDVLCFRYYYDPEEEEELPEDPYAAYADDKILGQWRSVLPEENVIVINDPKAIMDVILGVIALQEGTRTIDSFDKDLDDRDQSDERRALVRNALAKASQSGSTKDRPVASTLPKKKKKKS